MSHHDLKKYKEAIEDYTEAIRLNPHDKTIYGNRVLSYNALRNSN